MMKKILFLLVPFILSCGTVKKEKDLIKSTFNYQEEYKNGFINNPRSPLNEADLVFLDFFTPDITWKLSCKCEKIENATPFDMPTYSGVFRKYVVYAKAICKRGRNEFSVFLYQNVQPPVNPLYKSQLFLPFKDLTNDESTYGGGRYLNVQVSDIENDRITLDFNRCYNPWCAYSDGYNCPIPPRENRLDMAILAGEKKYKGVYKKSEKK